MYAGVVCQLIHLYAGSGVRCPDWVFDKGGMVNLLVQRRKREERLGKYVLHVIFRIGASVRRGSRTGGAAGVAVLWREQV